jgi:hypothetical protein
VAHLVAIGPDICGDVINKFVSAPGFSEAKSSQAHQWDEN